MQSKRILVVDDDRSVRLMYRTVLTLAGFTVAVADDGLSALRVLEQDPPDLIVLDLHLPRVDGLAVLSELRAHRRTRRIPVVVVTGADYQHAVAQATAILRKPCLPEQLLSAVEEHLSPAA